jgi:hypothetical protein
MIVNNVRTFLQVTTLAEISDNGGKHIHPAFTQTSPTKRHPHNGISKLRWPPQPPPTARMWRIWLKHIKSICKPTSWILKYQLGPWTTYHSSQRDWYGQISHDIVFTKTYTWIKTK